MTTLRGSRVAVAAAMSLLVPMGASWTSRADTWRGTAPFCAGHCLAGETQIGSSSMGNGGYCVTGHKALCSNTQTTCVPRATKTSCYGVVQVCDNGFQEGNAGNWHSCATYGCGICFGVSHDDTVTPASLGHGGGGRAIDMSGPCKQGFVWREAIANDRVCVTPATRTQSATDNAQAAQRRDPAGAYGPDTCKAGFVWREVVPTDHVCVTPAVRAGAAADTSAAAGRVAGR